MLTVLQGINMEGIESDLRFYIRHINGNFESIEAEREKYISEFKGTEIHFDVEGLYSKQAEKESAVNVQSPSQGMVEGEESPVVEVQTLSQGVKEEEPVVGTFIDEEDDEEDTIADEIYRDPVVDEDEDDSEGVDEDEDGVQDTSIDEEFYFGDEEGTENFENDGFDDDDQDTLESDEGYDDLISASEIINSEPNEDEPEEDDSDEEGSFDFGSFDDSEDEEFFSNEELSSTPSEEKIESGQPSRMMRDMSAVRYRRGRDTKFGTDLGRRDLDSVRRPIGRRRGIDDSWRSASEVGDVEDLWSFDKMKDGTDSASEMLYSMISKSDSLRRESEMNTLESLSRFSKMYIDSESGKVVVSERKSDAREEKENNQIKESTIDIINDDFSEKKESEQKKEEIKLEERDLGTVYKSLRDFIKKHPNCPTEDALKYFSSEEISKEVRLGRVYLRRNRLFI